MKSTMIAALANTSDKQAAVGRGAAGKSRVKILPDAGKYECSLEDVDAFNTETDGDTYTNLTLKFKVEDGPKSGQIFERTFWGNSEWDLSALLDFCTVITGMTPEPDQVVQQAGPALDAAKGAAVKINITSKPAKDKPGVTYKNVNIIAA